MDPIAITVLELAGAAAAAFVAFAAGYATFLALSGRRKIMNLDRLTSFGFLAPTIWVGMSAMTALVGAYNELLPNSMLAFGYAGLICILPASWLAHSVIEDVALANSVSPSRETSRKSTSAPKRNSTLPPPPNHW